MKLTTWEPTLCLTYEIDILPMAGRHEMNMASNSTESDKHPVSRSLDFGVGSETESEMDMSSDLLQFTLGMKDGDKEAALPGSPSRNFPDVDWLSKLKEVADEIEVDSGDDPLELSGLIGDGEYDVTVESTETEDGKGNKTKTVVKESFEETGSTSVVKNAQGEVITDETTRHENKSKLSKKDTGQSNRNENKREHKTIRIEQGAGYNSVTTEDIKQNTMSLLKNESEVKSPVQRLVGFTKYEVENNVQITKIRLIPKVSTIMVNTYLKKNW